MTEPSISRGAAEPPRAPAGAAEWEYRVLTLPRGVTRPDARRLLAEQAEYGHWELVRVRLYLGGARRVWLRRRIMRVARTA
jgi:hypothetical protein